MNFETLTRRDFMKRTTALAVGVSSISLFSGLVDAQVYVCTEGSPCTIKKTSTGIQIPWQGKNHTEYECECTGVPGCCTPSTLTCGQWWDDAGNIMTVRVDCSLGHPAKTYRCILP